MNRLFSKVVETDRRSPLKLVLNCKDDPCSQFYDMMDLQEGQFKIEIFTVETQHSQDQRFSCDTVYAVAGQMSFGTLPKSLAQTMGIGDADHRFIHLHLKTHQGLSLHPERFLGANVVKWDGTTMTGLCTGHKILSDLKDTPAMMEDGRDHVDSLKYALAFPPVNEGGMAFLLYPQRCTDGCEPSWTTHMQKRDHSEGESKGLWKLAYVVLVVPAQFIS